MNHQPKNQDKVALLQVKDLIDVSDIWYMSKTFDEYVSHSINVWKISDLLLDLNSNVILEDILFWVIESVSDLKNENFHWRTKRADCDCSTVLWPVCQKFGRKQAFVLDLISFLSSNEKSPNIRDTCMACSKYEGQYCVREY